MTSEQAYQAMKKEWSIAKIREFVKKNFQSVAARMTKEMLSYYDEREKDIAKDVLVWYIGKQVSDKDSFNGKTISEIVNIYKLTNP